MEVGQVIHSDVNGPMQTVSPGGAGYFVCLKDNYSRYRRVFFVERKTAAEVGESIEAFLNEAEARGHIVKQLRTDSGTEYVNEKVAGILAARGIECTHRNLTGPQGGRCELSLKQREQ